MAGGSIHVVSRQDWLEAETKHLESIQQKCPELFKATVDVHTQLMQQLEAAIARFPFTVILEGPDYEHEFVSRWCWQNVGPESGKCLESASEHPGCPLVLATEQIEKGSYKDEKGEEHFWKRKTYQRVADHSHEGPWCSLMFWKTGYDYRPGMYCFANEPDRDRMVAALPTIDFDGD